jgi:hypothetical protein
VCANDAGNVVRHVDLLLQVVSQLPGEEFKSIGIEVAGIKTKRSSAESPMGRSSESGGGTAPPKLSSVIKLFARLRL